MIHGLPREVGEPGKQLALLDRKTPHEGRGQGQATLDADKE